MEARHYNIMGKVQGVGYRYFTQDVASELKLTGWVRNLPNGNVECMVAGPVSNLEIFEKKIRKGPPLSRVVNMEKNKISVDEIGLHGGFEIRP